MTPGDEEIKMKADLWGWDRDKRTNRRSQRDVTSTEQQHNTDDEFFIDALPTGRSCGFRGESYSLS